MHIDSYQFGRIVIDGETHTSDCLIVAGAVRSGWWRRQGHLLSADDLAEVIEAAPSIVVIGTGASAMMKVPEQSRQFLEQQDIEVEVLDTKRAVARFNELSLSGASVAAALHLTC
jgi:hypothetical protein